MLGSVTGAVRPVRSGVIAACVVLFLLLGVVPAVADELEDALQRGGFDPARRAAIHALFDQAAGQGIPPRLLLPRLEEGLAKRVSAGRLLGAIEREVDFLLAARRILREEAAAMARDEAAWARTANLLAGGLQDAEVRALVQIASARPRDFRAATYLYVALSEWRLPRETAVALLEALLGSELPGEEFGGIVGLLAEGRSARIPPERLVERVRRALPGVRSLDELKRMVLY
ncbi:MAG: hypothetical protein JW820_16775 [Spirochaetales bacterium]|nr:hypothetical protein [Spirochaetales bacterium]